MRIVAGRSLHCILILATAFVAPLRADDAPLRWPEVPPAQLREAVFGVRFHYTREIHGEKAALALLQKEQARDPQPYLKAYMAWTILFGDEGGHQNILEQLRGIALAEEAMAEGSVTAADVLARARTLGIDGVADPTEVVALLRKAADGGAPYSMGRLGNDYAIGYGVPRDLVAADRWMQRAAERGSADGLVQMGDWMAAGAVDGKKDLLRAVGYYYQAGCYRDVNAWKKLAQLQKRRVPEAKLYLALSYVRQANWVAWLGPWHVGDYLKTVVELGGDNPLALVEIGRTHLEGAMANTDYKLARDCFERAAAAGNRDARFFLAKMKLRGFGEPAQRDDAMAAITALADDGVAEAANYLGYLYYWGTKDVPGAKADEAKAFAYARQAAEKGHPVALANLGDCYESGIGTPKNYALAAIIYWRAYHAGFQLVRDRVPADLAFVK